MIWLMVGSFLFYTLNVTGFRVGRFVLCGSCLKDEPIDLVFWVMYGAAVGTFIFVPQVGQWILLGIFVLFHIVQIVFTYRYWFFPNQKKIASYNKFFAATHHIIKPSDTVLVPDTFHLLLFIMFFINLIAICVYIFA